MPQTTLLILIGALGILTGYLLACLRRQARRNKTKTFKGNALLQSDQKKKHKARVMELVTERGEIRNTSSKSNYPATQPLNFTRILN